MTDLTSIRRILVALDASPASLEGLKTAAELAERLNAELFGLFVEDIDLLRAVELPFAQEIGYLSQVGRRLEPSRLEQQLRGQAEQIRRALAAAADRRGLTWNFRTIRGPVARELISAGTEADLIVMGRSGRSFLGSRRVGSAVRAVIAQRRGLTMILHRCCEPDQPVVVYDGTETARKALDAALHFMVDRQGPISVFLLADSKAEAQAFREAVAEQLKPHGLKARFRPLISSNPMVVAHFVGMESTGPLLLPAEKWSGREAELLELVKEVTNPVLVVK